MYKNIKSLSCTPETHIILYVNDSSIRVKNITISLKQLVSQALLIVCSIFLTKKKNSKCKIFKLAKHRHIIILILNTSLLK